MAEFRKFAERDEILPGGRKSIIIEELPALLIRIGDNYFAIEDVCTHDGQPLTDGPIEGCEIVCPRHGAKFDVRTGKPTRMPATQPVDTYEVEVREDGIYVRPRD